MALVVVIWLVAAGVGVIGLIYWYWYFRRAPRAAMPPAIAGRQQELRRRLQEMIARVPVAPRLYTSEVPAHPRAASIEAKLLSGTIMSALDEAEELFAESPGDVRVQLLMARVLIHRGDLRAAAAVIARARLFGASGPMIEYLEGRARQLHLQRRVQLKENAGENGAEWDAELITPFEMFALQLERRRSRATAPVWLVASTGDKAEALEPEKLIALLAEHFSAYYDCLDKLAGAVEKEPGFSDALYHAARMALKAGFIDEGLLLMSKIGPLMASSPERRFYEQDIKFLHAEGPWTRAMGTIEMRSAPSAAGQVPPVAVEAADGRTTRLKVVN